MVMSKKRNEAAKQDRVGVAAVQQIVTSELEWIFREQPTDDYGIDAQFEVVEGNMPTGRLVAVQIKSGESYFQNEDTTGWWFWLKQDDLEYWLKHALPVVVIIYDPSGKEAFWAAVDRRTIVTGERGGKKLLIPRIQRLGAGSASALARASEGRPEELRIRELRLALPWMVLLNSGRRILVEAEEWVNKTSGRGDIRIVSVDDANEDRVELGAWYLRAGSRPYDEVLPSLVPWADTVLHEETYEEADYDAWEAECVQYDREGFRIVTQLYEDWHLTQFSESYLRPYATGAGEVDFWRLELVLNDLGKGFIAVTKFVNTDGWILTPSAAPS